MTETYVNTTIKPDDPETTSFSSQQSAKVKSAVFVKELRSNIRTQLAKNQSKYESVVKQNPMFSMTLYEPKMDKALQNSSQLLAIKLDRLMEDEYALDKELSKIHFKKQDDEEIKAYELKNQMNHYLFLRKAWKKPKESNQLEQQMDYINHTVGLIKGHIKHMTRAENITNHSLSELIKESHEYRELEKELQQLGKKQQLAKQELREKIKALETANLKISEQNQALINKIHEKNDEKRKKEEIVIELKQKIQTLEIKVLQKQRQLKNLAIVDERKTIDKQDTNNEIVVEAVDKSFIVVLKSKIGCEWVKTTTSRKLTEIRSFLERKNPLQGILEDGNYKLLQEINKQERNKPIVPDFSLTSKVFVPPRRLTIEKADRNRTELFLGSQEKKRRFERTRIE